MFISRLCKICNNNPNTISLITTLLSSWTRDEISTLFTQLENNQIIGDKLYIIFKNECNNDYNNLFTLDYSKFDNEYFMNQDLSKLSV